jgi:hypothetical protein
MREKAASSSTSSRLRAAQAARRRSEARRGADVVMTSVCGNQSAERVCDFCVAAMIPKTTATERKTTRLAGCCHAANRKSRDATIHRRQRQGLRTGGRSFTVDIREVYPSRATISSTMPPS